MRIIIMRIIQLISIGLSQALTQDVIEAMRYKPSDITRISIMSEHSKLSDESYITNDRIVQLAYITPWNNHGYELARKTAHKLSYVSPVWLQAKPEFQNNDELMNCKIEGSHDIDRDWIDDLRYRNPKIKIVPRILFDGWNYKEMEQVLINTQAAINCSKTIAEFYERNVFDGAVVEIYIQALMAVQKLETKTLIVEMMEVIAKKMRTNGLKVIFTVPAPLEANNQPNKFIEPQEYERLIAAADYVQIMTYDYRGHKPTGVSPYDWVENCIFYLGGERTPKTLVGINWYGYEFSRNGVEAVTSGRFLEVLKDPDATYEFDEEVMEHRLKNRNSVIYYPSLTSLEARIKLAHRYEAGIAIWDYGQGHLISRKERVIRNLATSFTYEYDDYSRVISIQPVIEKSVFESIQISYDERTRHESGVNGFSIIRDSTTK